MAQINSFVFSLATRIEFGLDCAGQVASRVCDLGAGKPLLVTDPGVLRAGLLEPVLQAFRAMDLPVVVFGEVASNPTADNVHCSAVTARREGCDVVVAVGGGSAIDTAKGAAVVAALGGQIADYQGWEAIPGRPLPVIAIPTTAGTGSEVSSWAVIGSADEHRKMLIGSHKITPAVALLDPVLTYSLPARLTAYTGLDALTHAIEAYTSTVSNPVSDALAIAAIERIGRSLLRAVEVPRDQGARSEMLLASTMAAAAFNSADLGAVHCMSEALGGMYDIHHGLANAILLVGVMEFNAPAVSHKYADIGQALSAGDSDGVAAVRRLVEKLSIPSLSQAGIRQEDLPRLAALSAQNISVPSNPRRITEDDFLRLFREAF